MSETEAKAPPAKGIESFGGRAYYIREALGPRTTWADIADTLNYRPDRPRLLRAEALLVRAKRYALRRSLPWPPQAPETGIPA